MSVKSLSLGLALGASLILAASGSGIFSRISVGILAGHRPAIEKSGSEKAAPKRTLFVQSQQVASIVEDPLSGAELVSLWRSNDNGGVSIKRPDDTIESLRLGDKFEGTILQRIDGREAIFTTASGERSLSMPSNVSAERAANNADASINTRAPKPEGFARAKPSGM